MAIDFVQNLLDPVAVRIKIPQPIQRGALIIRAAPAPGFLAREQIREFADQRVAGHQSAGKEMTRDPIHRVLMIEPVGRGLVREHVQK